MYLFLFSYFVFYMFTINIISITIYVSMFLVPSFIILSSFIHFRKLICDALLRGNSMKQHILTKCPLLFTRKAFTKVCFRLICSPDLFGYISNVIGFTLRAN